jgi:hypothetical protein
MAPKDEERRRAPRITRSSSKSKSDDELSFTPEWRPGLTDVEMQHEMGPIMKYDDPT